MQLSVLFAGEELTVCLQGELDHHCASAAREQIDIAIDTYAPEVLVLDFSGLTFMDSSGIGLIMGRYRLMQSIGGTVKIKNVIPRCYKMLQMAGIERMMEVKFQ